MKNTVTSLNQPAVLHLLAHFRLQYALTRVLDGSSERCCNTLPTTPVYVAFENRQFYNKAFIQEFDQVCNGEQVSRVWTSLSNFFFNSTQLTLACTKCRKVNVYKKKLTKGVCWDTHLYENSSKQNADNFLRDIQNSCKDFCILMWLNNLVTVYWTL